MPSKKIEKPSLAIVAGTDHLMPGTSGAIERLIGYASVESMIDAKADAAALEREFNSPAPYILKSRKRAQRASNGDGGHRGSYGSGKRADVKRTMLADLIDSGLPRDAAAMSAWDARIADKHQSSLSSVRSIRSDFFASLSAWRDDLLPSLAACVRSAKPGSWIADFNAMVRDDPTIAALPAQSIVSHYAEKLSALGHSGFCLSKESIGASAKACLESLNICEAEGAFAAHDPAQLKLIA